MIRMKTQLGQSFPQRWKEMSEERAMRPKPSREETVHDVPVRDWPKYNTFIGLVRTASTLSMSLSFVLEVAMLAAPFKNNLVVLG